MSGKRKKCFDPSIDGSTKVGRPLKKGYTIHDAVLLVSVLDKSFAGNIVDNGVGIGDEFSCSQKLRVSLY
jgi:tRNA1(Val) A37 N6-methylase TrmN6